MLAIAVAPEIQNFWAPVSQIVPVFALALVIEARRLSKTWVAGRKLERRLVPVALAIVAFILYLIESEALTRMLSGEHDAERAAWVMLGLLVAATGIGVQPIYNLVVDANMDLVRFVVRSLPWSNYRKMTRKMQEVLHDYSEMAATQLRQDEAMDVVVERALSNLSAQKDGLAEVDELLAGSPLPPEIEQSLLAMRKKLTLGLPEAAEALAEARKMRREVQRAGVALERSIAKTEKWTNELPNRAKEMDTAELEESLDELKKRHE